MKKKPFKREDRNSIIVAFAIALIVLVATFKVEHYKGRKKARREIENCQFELRNNADARRTYVATAPEINRNKHLHKVIDSLARTNDSLVLENPKQYEKNQRLISRLEWIVDYNDSVANAHLAEFDSVRNRLLRKIEENKARLQ